MSYLALARKWRPATFQQVVGQQHVLSAIGNALDNNKLHHAYLFSGTRGVGKTTIGRIFAKGLNCETGVTGNPCGKCATCKEIDEGRFVDLLEIDAASRTKVEDTRELLDNVQYKPARGRYKVYLIDEVHMLSRHSFNALLKTLEEPPEYVKFLLATTDPQKLPVTILSRCLQFHLKPHKLDDIAAQLAHILTQEQVEFDAKALQHLAHAGDGSMRDALSLTDQAIALGNGKVDEPTVHSMLGTIDANYALQLIRSLALNEAKSLFDTLDHIASLGADWDVLLKQMAEHLHRIAMYQVLPASLDEAEPETAILSSLAQQWSPEAVQLYYEIVIKGRQSLSLAPRPQQGVEMVLLRLLAFKPKAKQTQALTIDAQDEPASVELPQVKPTAATPQKSETVEKVVTPQVKVDAEPAPAPAPAPETSLVAAKPQPPLSESVEPTTPQANAPQQSGAATPVASESDKPQAESKLNPTPQQVPRQQPVKPVSSAPAQPMYDDVPEYPSEDEYQPMSYQDGAYDNQASPQPAANQAPQAPAPQQKVAPAQPSAPATGSGSSVTQSSIGGLRHQLRSKRMQLSQTDSGDTSGKKPGKAASKSSIFDRLADKSSAMPARSQSTSTSPASAPQANANEPYQWRPSEAAQQQAKAEKKPELTPAQLKKALQHERTPEMNQKLQLQALAEDEWAKLVASLSIPKMVEQLALNSNCVRQGNAFSLSLRASQSHLNSDKAIEILSEAITTATGEQATVSVSVGEEGQTPLELKDKLYQQKLSHAFDTLQQDEHIQFLQNRFGADLDNESVRPI